MIHRKADAIAVKGCRDAHRATGLARLFDPAADHALPSKFSELYASKNDPRRRLPPGGRPTWW